MKISIIRGTIEYLEDCKEALMNSQLGEIYYENENIVNNILKDGMDKGEIYIALDDNNQGIGYVWFTLTGAFYGFPYLRSIAVKKGYRKRGVGKKLLGYFEESGFRHRPKIFLLVSDFNIMAKELYERAGYREVGVIPNLFKEGISEYIMIKSK